MNFKSLFFHLHWRVREFNERLCLLFSKDIILVYTMGKVGSTSIYYSLKDKLKGRVLFIHRMIKENINVYNKAFIRKDIKPHRSKMGELVLDKLGSKKFKIITMVREPIGRNISDFFQDLNVYLDDPTRIDSFDDEFVRNQFLKNYPHEIPLKWFSDEFKRTTNINIFEHTFDIQKKFCFIKHNSIEVLIIRVDLEDEKKEQLIKDFLSLKDLKIKRHNTAHQKSYHSKYKSFLRNCKFDDAYVCKMLDSIYSRHFYSVDEIEQLRSLYGNKSNEDA